MYIRHYSSTKRYLPLTAQAVGQQAFIWSCLLSSPIWAGSKAFASQDSNASPPPSGNSGSWVVEPEQPAQPAVTPAPVATPLQVPEQNSPLPSLLTASPAPEWWTLPESTSAQPVAPLATAPAVKTASAEKSVTDREKSLANRDTQPVIAPGQVSSLPSPSESILLRKLKKGSGDLSNAAIATPQSVSPSLDRSALANTADALAPTPGLPVSSTPGDDRDLPAGAKQLQSQQTAPSDQVIEDPELGVLRLQELPCRDFDPELGCLRLRESPPPPASPPAKYVYLFARVDYFRSSNVYSALDPVDDGLVRPGLTFYATPPLGPDTYFVLAADANLIRYSTQTQLNYNELNLRAGILQRLSPVMYGELGWGYQQLFTAGNEIVGFPAGTRFLNDHGLRLELSRRDQLSPKLLLTTYYQFRYGFADPDSRSRVINSLYTSLSYQLQPTLQVGLDYQFSLANFTRIDREDQYHQLVARLTYTAFRNTQFNLFAGYSFGHSSDPTVNFDGLILGVNMTLTFGLF